jgi:outer membrane receptor protein involved in Fe transport
MFCLTLTLTMNNVRNSLTALALLACAWPLSAQTVAPATDPATPARSPAATKKLEDDAVTVLTPFEVTSTKDTGYQTTETLAGTRIRTDLKDVGAALSVYTKDFLNDIGATDATTFLQYTTNAEVAGTRGTYLGAGNGTNLDESGNLRSPAGAQRTRGLAASDNTRDFFVTDIPWDGYNVDRIDILRGPNSFLFGLGSPAGIQNASIHGADFRNYGSIEARTGSYNSFRSSFDFNQQIIPGMLAIRVDGLLDDQKFEQKGAYDDKRRGSFALKFDPQLFRDRSAHTSFRVKLENGNTSADRPRTLAPYDSITPWWSAMGKLAISSPQLFQIGTNTAAVNPWLSGGPANQQQPIWLIDGNSNQLYQIYGGFVNTGALSATGTAGSASTSLIGQSFSNEFLGITGYNGFANASGLPNAGQTRDKSLTDSSVFNFYKNLIDGPTKMEFEKFNTANFDLQQTFLDDRIGLDVTYDHQKYKSGGQQLLGNPTLQIDVQKQFQDLSTNPNFGRPFVTGGPGGGNSYDSDRKYARGSLFAELRPNDFVHNEFLLKLLGKQRFNGVYGDEKYYNEQLRWVMYAHSQAWDGYWNQTNGATDSETGNRPPVAVIYLGSPLGALNSPSGANIPGITAPVALTSGGVYHFATTWKNPPGVNFSDPWAVPANLQPMFGGATTLTQASNPANYIGWNSNVQDNLLAYNMGQDKSLLTRAQKSLRETKSWAGSYQGYFWNDALVGTLGWRYDEVSTKDKTASAVNAARQTLDLTAQNYALPVDFPANQIVKGHSTSESFVVHLNKLFEKDHLPINISLTVNNASNFQVTSIRRDLYGNPLPDPTGSTRDYGLWLSTKDGKWSFRAVKYKTENTANDTGLTGIRDRIGSIIQQGMRWRNVYLYQLGAYTLSSANQDLGRNNWNQTYPAETPAQAIAEEDAAITGWNNIQTALAAKGFFSAWNFTPTGPTSALVTRTAYLNNPTGFAPDPNTVAQYVATAPQGFTVTADTESKGYEFELTANPLPNWRVSFNASQTTAVRNNFGGPALDEFMALMKAALVNADGTPTAAGKLSQFGNAAQFSLFTDQWVPLFAQYQLVKAQQGATVPELRKWRYNIVTNYSFIRGALKGVGVGGAYRWQDKVGIGYPIKADGSTDTSKPYYGPAEDGLDLWVSYERKVTAKINWKIQLNGRNMLAKDGLIPITVEPDGTWAAARIKPTQEWFLTNTFSF